MTAPQLLKTWTVTPNLRRAYVSLLDETSWLLYQNKAAMKLAGWTVRSSCNGVTGPANGSDTTDRWASEANVVTRATVAAAAQSWVVMQNADSVQVLLTFQGASDDIARIAFSPAGLYILAGTTTQQPTAADEIVVSAGNSLVNATTSLDRVMSIWTSSDTKQWCFAIFRSSTLLNYIGVEKINNLCYPAAIFGTGTVEIPYAGFRHTVVSRLGTVGAILNSASATALGAAGWTGQAGRVFTLATSRTNRFGGGYIINQSTAGSNVNGDTLDITSCFFSTIPAMQGGLGGGSPLLPIYWSGEKAANLDGLVGYPIDWWQMVTSALTTPALGDFVPGYDPADTPGVTAVRSNWLVALGAACVRPWRNAGATLEIA